MIFVIQPPKHVAHTDDAELMQDFYPKHSVSLNLCVPYLIYTTLMIINEIHYSYFTDMSYFLIQLYQSKVVSRRVATS